MGGVLRNLGARGRDLVEKLGRDSSRDSSRGGERIGGRDRGAGGG